MKIYLDPCCYSRPFDNVSHMIQQRVRAEVVAVIGVVDICKAEGFYVVGSRMVMFEINRIQDKVINPINFLQEYAVWLQSQM